jgi:hypothetical protein
MGSINTVAPDLNQIPAALIKRIEILTGGAGAVYGSDAVAGVVNFIMNDKFEGVQVDLNYSFNQHNQQDPDGCKASSTPAPPPTRASSRYPATRAPTAWWATWRSPWAATSPMGAASHAVLLLPQRGTPCSPPSATSAPATGGQRRGGGRNLRRLGHERHGPDSPELTTGTRLHATDFRRHGAPLQQQALDQFNFGPFNHYQRPDERYSAAAY